MSQTKTSTWTALKIMFVIQVFGIERGFRYSDRLAAKGR